MQIFCVNKIQQLIIYTENIFMKRKILEFTLLIFFTLSFTACLSLPKNKTVPSRCLTDRGIKNEKQLYKFFIEKNPKASKKTVRKLAKLYISEASTEGINSDCAFVQMCLETGFLEYGNLVKPDWNNYCGLGAIDASNPGEQFASPKEGVRAHIQHLHAYATTEEKLLVNQCIDRRYKYVKPRGKAKTVFELAGTWAADKSYGQKLDALLSCLENY
jgi:hypothetical protein